MKMFFLKVVLLWFVLSINIVNAQINQKNPVQMIKGLSTGVVEQLSVNQQKFIENPDKLLEFAKGYILPYVDTYKMARYVVGRQWKKISKNQQQEFATAFAQMLLRTYSSSLVKLNIKTIDVIKATGKRKNRKSIATEVTQKNGEKTAVVYRAYQDKKTNKWMVYDFSIEGISMLVNYRKTFSSEIAKKGLTQVIKNIKSQNNGEKKM